MSSCRRESKHHLLHYEDCADPAKMTSSRIDFVSRTMIYECTCKCNAAARSRQQQKSEPVISLHEQDIAPQCKGAAVAAVTQRGEHASAAAAAAAELWSSRCRAAPALLSFLRHRTELSRDCASGMCKQPAKAGRCAACHVRSVRDVCRQTGRGRERCRQNQPKEDRSESIAHSALLKKERQVLRVASKPLPSHKKKDACLRNEDFRKEKADAIKQNE